jgi:uncharacterized membrane protein YgdD (TMEM256/DUF423 family)
MVEINSMAGRVNRAVKIALITGAAFAMLSVAIGAFAAHGLTSVLSAYQLDIVETAAKYQMYHGLALILVGLMGIITPRVNIKFISIGFAVGVIAFSGSLYLLALFELRFMAFITPVGGLFLLAGWFAFIYQVFKLGSPKVIAEERDER